MNGKYFVSNYHDINNYQKVYKFTHNDLHTNNIMYNETKKEFFIIVIIIHTIKSDFGKIYKIIDFGRSIILLKIIYIVAIVLHHMVMLLLSII